MVLVRADLLDVRPDTIELEPAIAALGADKRLALDLCLLCSGCSGSPTARASGARSRSRPLPRCALARLSEHSEHSAAVQRADTHGSLGPAVHNS